MKIDKTNKYKPKSKNKYKYGIDKYKPKYKDKYKGATRCERGAACPACGNTTKDCSKNITHVWEKPNMCGNSHIY